MLEPGRDGRRPTDGLSEATRFRHPARHLNPVGESMIHRTGICILTFATSLGEEFDVNSGYRYLQAGARMLDRVELSIPIISRHCAIPKSTVELLRAEEIHDADRGAYRISNSAVSSTRSD